MPPPQIPRVEERSERRLYLRSVERNSLSSYKCKWNAKQYSIHGSRVGIIIVCDADISALNLGVGLLQVINYGITDKIILSRHSSSFHSPPDRGGSAFTDTRSTRGWRHRFRCRLSTHDLSYNGLLAYYCTSQRFCFSVFYNSYIKFLKKQLPNHLLVCWCGRDKMNNKVWAGYLLSVVPIKFLCTNTPLNSKKTFQHFDAWPNSHSKMLKYKFVGATWNSLLCHRYYVIEL